MCEPMGRREIFLTFSLLVEIEGHFTNEFVSYVYETEDLLKKAFLQNCFCDYRYSPPPTNKQIKKTFKIVA
jgi:hypothetical protein